MKFAIGLSRWTRVCCSALAVTTAALILLGQGATALAQEQNESGESQAAPTHAAKPQAAATAEQKKTFTDEEILSMLSTGDSMQRSSNRRKLEVPEAVPGLATILRDRQKPRMAAAMVLGGIGTPAAKEVLIEVLAKTRRPRMSFEPQADFYEALTSALGCCIERESEKQVIEDLRHENAPVRWIAARQLDKRKSTRAVPELIRLLDDPHHTVRLVATYALGNIRDPRGIDELIAIVEKRRTGGHRLAAVNKIRKVGTPRCTQALDSVKPDENAYWNVAYQIPPKLAKAFKVRTSHFKLVLEWVSPRGENANGSSSSSSPSGLASPPAEKKPRHPSLVLTVPEREPPRAWYGGTITQRQASRIIDHLLKEGYFRRAREMQNYGPLIPSRYCLKISTRTGPILCESPPWNLEFIRRLQALRKLLDGEGAKAMDAVLEQLEPQRKQWEDQAAARTDHK